MQFCGAVKTREHCNHIVSLPDDDEEPNPEDCFFQSEDVSESDEEARIVYIDTGESNLN